MCSSREFDLSHVGELIESTADIPSIRSRTTLVPRSLRKNAPSSNSQPQSSGKASDADAANGGVTAATRDTKDAPTTPMMSNDEFRKKFLN